MFNQWQTKTYKLLLPCKKLFFISILEEIKKFDHIEDGLKCWEMDGHSQVCYWDNKTLSQNFRRIFS